jgi:ADP-ribose pyrophosphatase YjhB (NUDIX family)
VQEEMTKPITPLVGADTFLVNDKSQVCLIQRSDTRLWALPGGCQDLGETPKQCAEREFYEETGLQIEATHLLGVFSSTLYSYDTYPYKENEFCHLLFFGRFLGGKERISGESKAIAWYSENSLPKLSDGHEPRIRFGFAWLKNKSIGPHFE